MNDASGLYNAAPDAQRRVDSVSRVVTHARSGALRNGVRRSDLEERARLLEVENKELQLTVRRLRRLAYFDPLTNLVNRRGFELGLSSEIRRATRVNAPLALLLCDVDHFKRLNDAHGHQLGDSVLSMLGEILRACCRRAGDLAARYGGEEFALLLPGTGARQSIEFGERIRSKVEQLTLAGCEGATCVKVTLSIGITTLPSLAPCAPSRLLSAADAALYRAKEAGRNRIRYAPCE